MVQHETFIFVDYLKFRRLAIVIFPILASGYAALLQSEFAIRRLRRLLDKRMQNSDAFTNHEAIESTANARPSTRPQLKKTITKSARVRVPKTRAVFD